ncbi:Purine ribonucleoside efflux pump NepI [Paraburkholderia hiiakae]|uniref:Purine ribonucleoside efflux pump NepI n=1 Tax=Paraburkholderia hiiakae TaxID=1081782 RepID=A0ABN7HSL5_9BURK|nr:MFS transporter [Paraburkholderia hiiakae]CAD6532784.1 Purine ribonucleoside efflux pump NepI [Paraburkholderia hiiakae]
MDTPQVTSSSAQELGDASVSQLHSPGGNRSSWFAVSSVAVGSFAFVATEYMPVGLLPQIAADLHVTSGTAGLMVTTPGVIAAIAAPAILLAAGRINRRAILLLLALLLLASNVVAATAPNFAVMLAGRAFLGVGLGGFWTVALGASGQLVRERHAARASAIIFMGITLATVIGVPLGTLIAELTSWRMSFFATAGLAAVALGAQALLLPAIPPRAAMKLSDFRAMLSRSSVRRSLLLVLFLFGAHFAAYTYIAPFLERDTSLPTASITPILFGFGVVGFVANFGFSAMVIRHLKESLFGLGVLIMLAMFTLPLLQASRIGVIAAVMVWGVAYGAIPLCLSVWMQMTSPDHPEAGSSLFVSTVQVAIALGSLGGGVIVDHIGIAATMRTGAYLALPGLVVMLTFQLNGATLKELLQR